MKRILTTAGLIATLTVTAAADEREVFFESRVRPLLAAKCLECHGDDEPEAGLRLTSRDTIVKGGESGPAAERDVPMTVC